MDIVVKWIVVDQLTAQTHQPYVILERPLTADPNERAFRQAASPLRDPARIGTVWVIKNSLLLPDNEQKWSMVNSGNSVVVPFNAYRTEHNAKSSILAVGLSLGIKAGSRLRELFGAEPDRIHLYLGNDLPVVENRLRAYVALAAIKF